jgi:hypothetical protein
VVLPGGFEATILSAAASTAIVTDLSGGNLSQILKGSVAAAVTAGLFYGVGSTFLVPALAALSSDSSPKMLNLRWHRSPSVDPLKSGFEVTQSVHHCGREAKVHATKGAGLPASATSVHSIARACGTSMARPSTSCASLRPRRSQSGNN